MLNTSPKKTKAIKTVDTGPILDTIADLFAPNILMPAETRNVGINVLIIAISKP